MYCIIGYCGALISNLTRPASYPPLDTMDQILGSPTHALVFQRPGTLYESILSTSKEANFKALYQNFVRNDMTYANITQFADEKHVVLMGDSSTTLNRFKVHYPYISGNGDSLTLNDHIYATYFILDKIAFYHRSLDKVFPSGYGVVVSKSLPEVRDCLDKWIKRMSQFGLFPKWRRETLRKVLSLTSHEAVTEGQKRILAYAESLPHESEENEPLSLFQLQSAFYAYLFMIVASSFGFIGEILLKVTTVDPPRARQKWP